MTQQTGHSPYRVQVWRDSLGQRRFSITLGGRLIALLRNIRIAESYTKLHTLRTSVDSAGKPEE